MKIRIPQNKRERWRGIYPSRFAGDISEGFNVDLITSPSRVLLTGMSRVLIDNTTGVPTQFFNVNLDGTQKWWAIASDVLRSTSFATGWAADTYANSPSGIVDAVLHGDTDHSDTDPEQRLLAILQSDIAIFNRVGAVKTWDTNWWSDTTGGGLSQAVFDENDHCVTKIQKLVIITDGPRAHTIDRNDVVNRNRLSFPLGLKTACLYSDNQKAWFGLESDLGENGTIIDWNGADETWNKDYKFDGQPISGFIAAGIPYFINDRSQILRFNGSGFREFAKWNSYFEGLGVTVHKHGCLVQGRYVYIVVKSPEESKTVRSGVWVLDLENGDLFPHNGLSSDTGDTVTYDFGQPFLNNVGGIERADADDFLIGARYYKSYTSDIRSAIFRLIQNRTSGSQPNRGFIVTPKLFTDAFSNTWHKIWLVFKRFVHASNSFVIKQRVEEPIVDSANDSVRATCTWVDGNTFDGTIPSGVAVGDEIEVLAGQNGGFLAHISSITDTDGVAATPDGATNLRVNLDESGPSDTTNGSLIRFDNWVKTGTISDTGLTKYYGYLGLAGADSDGNSVNNGYASEFKIEFRGRAMELDEINVITRESLEAE